MSSLLAVLTHSAKISLRDSSAARANLTKERKYRMMNEEEKEEEEEEEREATSYDLSHDMTRLRLWLSDLLEREDRFFRKASKEYWKETGKY